MTNRQIVNVVPKTWAAARSDSKKCNSAGFDLGLGWRLVRAQQITRGVSIAVKRPGVPIPEIEVARERLSDIYDFHFGICTNAFDGVLNLTIRSDKDLQGLGPRILDIKNRGGRTAEDSLHMEMGRGGRARGGRLMEMHGQVAQDENKPIKPGKDVFPVGARRFDAVAGGVQNIGGQSKYIGGKDSNTGAILPATHKDQTADYVQMATRWSKAALELALRPQGQHIHFHLDGMGDISQIVGRTGDYAYNVTARELRYVQRNWSRFQWSVIFYNGYTANGEAVMVELPWLADWQNDNAAPNCPHCGEAFTKLRWRHHCRGCGRIFCDTCCSQKKRLAWPVVQPGKQPETGPVRLCANCYPRF
jgi:FYVE zinc finger